MKRIFRKVIPQWAINNFKHKPTAFYANLKYGRPSEKLTVIGVTGTDGKTTTTNMIYQILKEAGKKTSMVSTINAVIAGKEIDTGFHVTSPDSILVQKLLKESVRSGDEYIVLEVTSHALDQHRFDGIKFDVGVITNITHEHLDYHKTFKNYFETKLKLLKNVKFAVVNQNLGIKGVTFGLNKGDFNQKRLELKLKIPGNYNIENALAAMAVATSLGIDQKIARRVVENFSSLTGRMEEIKNNKGIKIIIDFAHTPNALEQALKALRSQVASGRLIAVFGCAGERDEQKRPKMGEIAQKLANLVVITAEDPRGQIEKINKQILVGSLKAKGVIDKNLFVINDRSKAISFAINNLAKKGDTVGIFGKGHEKSINIDGKKEIPWSDEKAVLDALRNG